MKQLPAIDFKRVDKLIRLALEEDLGAKGDITTTAVIPADTKAHAILLCKQDGVMAGLQIAQRVFSKLDPGCIWIQKVQDGDFCSKGTVIAEVSSQAAALLTAERTALNFLQRLCGIATTARRYAEAVANTKTQILDTRKTTPGWRNLEKYAVAAGGASNHRVGLYDRVLIKDNHRELAGQEGPMGITRCIQRARAMWPGVIIQAEADTLDEVREAIKAGADYILLDNMSNEQMAEAVKINNGKCKLEASGGITIERIPSIAALGVDFISCGALTHSVKALDISLDIKLN